MKLNNSENSDQEIITLDVLAYLHLHVKLQTLHLKKVCDSIGPYSQNIINRSLSSGVLLTTFKHAGVQPFDLKKEEERNLIGTLGSFPILDQFANLFQNCTYTIGIFFRYKWHS